MGRPKGLPQVMPAFLRIVRRLWPYVRKNRVLMSAALAAVLARVALRLLEPWPIKWVFDRVLVPVPDPRDGLPFLGALDAGTLTIVAALTVMAIFGLRALAEYWSSVWFAIVGNRVVTEVRDDLYRHLQRLSLGFHTRARTGDLLVRVSGDIALLRDAAVAALLPLLANLLLLGVMALVMVVVDWRLALLAGASLPLYALSSVRLSRGIREVARRQRQREGLLAASAVESIGGMSTVQAMSMEDIFAAGFSSENVGIMKENVQGRRLSAKLERTVDVMYGISSALVLWFGAGLVLGGERTPGDLIVFLSYLRTGFRPLRDFAKYSARLSKATVAGDRVLEVLERAPDVRDLPGAVPAPPLRGEVRFERVTFGYEPERPVLKDLSLHVPAGRRVALAGPSGIGKSTMLSLLLRLYDPWEGRVLLDGRDTREYTVASLRAQVSIVLQDSLLFAASVRDNIAYGAPRATREDIEAAARLANAQRFVEALPKGYDTVVGERGVTLSQGQRQRIAIARAAVRKAPLLLLDEPTNGLDEASERTVVEALERLADGRTTFLVTHDLRLASRADIIVYLDEGGVREQGTHDELLRAGGRYAELYQLQTGDGHGGVGEVRPDAVRV